MEAKPSTNSDANYYVYYKTQSSLVDKEDVSYDVLAQKGDYANGGVTYPNTLTKTNIDDLYNKDSNGNITTQNTGVQPKLTFKAFAVQNEGVADATTAWSYVAADEKLDYVATP